MGIKQIAYMLMGFIAVGLGTAGIFLPLLPTTPFLLLATFLFARSNKRWHTWLIEHKRLGPYIAVFRTKTGLTREQKLRMRISFTVLFSISIYFVPLLAVKIGLIAGWVFWMGFIYRIKTAPSPISIARAEREVPLSPVSKTELLAR